MTTDSRLVGDSFATGFRFQRYWDTPMANAFFCCEAGAGLYFVAMLQDLAVGMFVGFLLACVGKPYFHLSHMGVPGRSWRAMLRPDRSWISRGLLAIAVFGASATVALVAAVFDWTGPLPALARVLSGASALVVMSYQGFAMSHSTAIALWSTGVMPVASLLYALGSGTLLTLLLGAWSLGDGARAELVRIALVLLLAIGATLASLVHAARHGSPGARFSADLLLRTTYARWFGPVVAGAGVLVPAALLWLGGAHPAAVLPATAAMLAGFWAFRVLVFKAGVFEPVLGFRPTVPASRRAA